MLTYRHNTILLLSLSFALVLLAACDTPSSPPQISDISVESGHLLTGQTVTLIVKASGQDLKFEWTAEKGTLSSDSTSSVMYTAPNSPGPDLVTVNVTSKGGDAVQSLTLQIISPTSTAPPTSAPPTSAPTLPPSVTTLPPPTETSMLPSPTDTPLPTSTDLPTAPTSTPVAPTSTPPAPTSTPPAPTSTPTVPPPTPPAPTTPTCPPSATPEAIPEGYLAPGAEIISVRLQVGDEERLVNQQETLLQLEAGDTLQVLEVIFACPTDFTASDNISGEAYLRKAGTCPDDFDWQDGRFAYGTPIQAGQRSLAPFIHPGGGDWAWKAERGWNRLVIVLVHNFPSGEVVDARFFINLYVT